MLSRFVHIYENNGVISYYHSLKNIPLYLTGEENSLLDNFLTTGIKNSCNQEIISLFEENGFLVANDEDDSNLVNTVKKDHPAPAITTAYFVLSEDCNMACSYCFLGNAKKYFCGL